MADDPNPALRAELVAAEAVLDPEIRGLLNIILLPISTNLRAVVQQVIQDRERRRKLIQTVLDYLNGVVTAMNALEADGYPALGSSTVEVELLAELQAELADIAAGVGIFTGPGLASSISINLGIPTTKGT
jgi:hypothetical protein